MVRMDKFAVAIRALDKAVAFGDLQIDPGMAQRAFAAVAGDTIAVYDPGFWRFDGHRWRSFWNSFKRFYEAGAHQGQGLQ